MFVIQHSMEKIIEVVPNFSTSDPLVIKKIASAIKSVPNTRLLNVEPDIDYNRVVVTFVGDPNSVGEAAFQAIKMASKEIDMSLHHGEHPRIGATDVCPFVPVKDVNEEVCINIAKEVAKRVAAELQIPTYLYAKAATSPQRVKLSDIRSGEYEGLEEKLKNPDWAPDYGEPKFNKKSGATVIGVRDFLIAYNVNLDTQNVDISKKIGGLVRESGRFVEQNGEKVRVPGLLKGIQGMGVALERPERKLTQVSMNVLNFKEQTKMHEAFEEVKKQAEKLGVNVTGSEIVGLVPLDAILFAGRFYAPEEEDEEKLIEIAVKKLGLNDLDPFYPNKKIIELIINSNFLIDLTLSEFLANLSSSSPTPGGGSVAALGGALASSLMTMVSNLTIGREKYAQVENEIKYIKTNLEKISSEINELIDEDTFAFNKVMSAYKVPKTETEQRQKAIEKASIYASEIPLRVAELSKKLLDSAIILAEKGNKNAISDVGVAVLFASSTIKGALMNVKINLFGIKDQNQINQFREKIQEIEKDLDSQVNQILSLVEKEFS